MKRHREKALLGAGALLGFGIFTGTITWQQRDRPVTAPIPTPALPTPNGYTDYVRAGKAVVYRDPTTGTELRQRPLAALADRRSLVKINLPALALLHQGFRYPCRRPAQRAKSRDMSFDNEPLRRLSDVLSTAARVRLDSGDAKGTFDYGLDNVRLGVDSARGGGYLAHIVGFSLEAQGERHLMATVALLSAGDARACARRLETIAATRAPYADAVQEEKYEGQSQIAALFLTRTIPLSLGLANFDTAVGFGGKTRALFGAIGIGARLLCKGKQAIYDDHTTFRDREIAMVRVPYSQMPPVPPPPPHDVVNDDFFDSGSLTPRIYLSYTVAQTQVEILTAALALRAYHTERRDYPRALTDLVTNGYLKHAPTDPFGPAATTPLGYRRLGPDRFLLYSRGADGKDDAGSPCPPRKDISGNIEHRIMAGQQGDFVYGVNTYPN